MAAKSLRELVKNLNIQLRMEQIICLPCPMSELAGRIEKVSKDIEAQCLNELRDFFGHEIMKMEKEKPGTAKALFDRVFKDIYPEGSKNEESS